MQTNTNSGRLMPQATDAEKAVITSILTDVRIIPAVENIVAPSEFYNPRHAIIYHAALRLHARNEWS